MASLTHKRLWHLGLIVFLIPLGAFTKYYDGVAELWIKYHFGDIIYEVFWCLLGAFLFPKTAIKKIIIIVFSITSVLEFLQLWQPAFLTTIRNTFIGHALLGSNFDPWDFAYYALGCFIAYKWLTKIDTIQND